MKMFLKASPWVRVYDGDGGDGAGAGAGAGAGVGAADKTPAKTFTQDDVNKFLAEDRRKHQAQKEQTISQLEELKKAKGMSDEQQTLLQTQIDELKNSLLTKEEQAKRDKEKMEKGYKEERSKLETEREMWKTNFAKESINNAIITASARHKAISAEQLQALLFPSTRITEVLADGKPTGSFTPKVKFSDKDKDGNPIELDLTIEDAVKRMKELPERFGNLFESDSSGGIGGYGGGRGGRASDPSKPPSDPVAYQKWRKETGGFTGRKR